MFFSNPSLFLIRNLNCVVFDINVEKFAKLTSMTHFCTLINMNSNFNRWLHNPDRAVEPFATPEI